MNKFLKISLLVFYAFICNLIQAHNPNEAYYKIKVNNDQQQLVIHLTPKTASNLLRHLLPDLKLKDSIQLEDYLSDFQRYFSKTINLKIDSIPIHIQLTNHNLKVHDATLTFTLAKLQMPVKHFEISITSFLTLYNNMLNIVRVDLNGKVTGCVLDEKSTICSSEHRVEIISLIRNNIYYILSLILIGLILLFLILKKRKMAKVS